MLAQGEVQIGEDRFSRLDVITDESVIRRIVPHLAIRTLKIACLHDPECGFAIPSNPTAVGARTNGVVEAPGWCASSGRGRWWRRRASRRGWCFAPRGVGTFAGEGGNRDRGENSERRDHERV